jgi:hypothetical protein
VSASTGGWRAFSRVVVRCFYLLGFRFTPPVSLLKMRRVTRFRGTLYVFEVQVPEMYIGNEHRD